MTLTLPESALQRLDDIAEDRATAVVKLLGNLPAIPSPEQGRVRLEELGRGRAVIIVARSKSLARIPFLSLIETTPGFFLLALDPGYDFTALELAVRDELEILAPKEKRERELLSELLDCFAKARKGKRGTTAGILLVGRGRSR